MRLIKDKQIATMAGLLRFIMVIMLSCSVFAKDKITYVIGANGPSGANSIVFWVDGTGQHGLEAQAHDYTEYEYGGQHGWGWQHGFTWDDALTGVASYNNPVCPTGPQLTPSCWHLPTKSELELLYKQKDVVGGFAKFFYWSSSELGIYGAWGRSFRSGLQLYFTKGNGLRVRAVRAF